MIQSVSERGPLPTAPTEPFQASRVLTVATAHFVHDLYLGSFPALLPSFISKFSLSDTRAGALFSFMQLPSVLQPFIGHLADRMALRYLLTLTPAITATLMSVLGWAPNYASLALLLLAAGVSSAALHPITSVTAGRLSGPYLGRGMGLWMMGGELGNTLGPIAVAGALHVLTLRGLPWLMALGWLASYLLHRQLRRVPLRPPSAAERPHLRASLGKMRRLMTLMAALLVVRAPATQAAAVFVPTLLTREGASTLVAAAALTTFEAAGILGTLLFSSISDRIGRRRILFAASVLAPLALFMFASLHGWAQVPFLALVGAACLSVHPVSLALVQETFPETRALANSLYISLNFLIAAGAAVIVGALGDAIGLRPAFEVAAGFMLLGLPLLLLLPADHQRT